MKRSLAQTRIGQATRAWAYILSLTVITLLTHEAGHYAALRAYGVDVAEVSLGFGPALWSIEHDPDQARRIPTRYVLRPILLGAYVIPRATDCGLRHPEESPVHPHHLCRLGPSERMVAVAAGIGASLLLALLTYFGLFLRGFPSSPPLVFEATGDLAEIIAPNSRIQTTRGRHVRSWQHFVALTSSRYRSKTVFVSPLRSIPTLLDHVCDGRFYDDLKISPALELQKLPAPRAALAALTGTTVQLVRWICVVYRTALFASPLRGIITGVNRTFPLEAHCLAAPWSVHAYEMASIATLTSALNLLPLAYLDGGTLLSQGIWYLTYNVGTVETFESWLTILTPVYLSIFALFKMLTYHAQREKPVNPHAPGAPAPRKGISVPLSGTKPVP